MSWFSDNDWLAWLGLALILGAIEVISVDFVFVMLAGGAVAGSAAAAAGFGFPAQVISAVVVATALLLGVRPIVRSHFRCLMATGRSARQLRWVVRRWCCRPSLSTTEESSLAVRPGRRARRRTPPYVCLDKRSG
jgi:hypothetical protein